MINTLLKITSIKKYNFNKFFCIFYIRKKPSYTSLFGKYSNVYKKYQPNKNNIHCGFFINIFKSIKIFIFKY